jgi:periplasmic divalent cation tolerance protein
MPDTDEYCVVYVTASDIGEARRVALAVVEKRLAACANILPGVESLYWWEGQVQSANETAVIFKTRPSLVPALSDAVKAAHSYQFPCVVVLPITGGNADYLRWIGDETVATTAAR